MSANQLTVIIPASANSSSFSNSTCSTSRSSLTYLKSSSSASSEDFWSTSTSSHYSPSFSTTTATSTGVGGFGAGGTGVASAGTASSTADSGNGNSNSNAPSTPVVVGGVVGSVAGAAIILFLLMFLLRWWKKRQSMLSLDSVDRGPGAITAAAVPSSQPPGGMSERRSYGVPAALAALNWHKRSSQKTDRTISSTAGSERGFYRVSGRKLPSVLQSGGDGYGGGIDTNTLSGSSFYRDSHGFYGGSGNPGPSNPPGGFSGQRDTGVPVMRPSPARTPVTEQSPFSDRFSTVPPPPSPPFQRPDTLGRSHPSQDGSHASRFTEEV